MPSFKPKSIKKFKVNKKNSTTLDGKHNEFVQEFQVDEVERIPKLKRELRKIEKIIEVTSGVQDIAAKEANIEFEMNCRDRAVNIRDSIKQLKSKRMNYLLGNSKYIFDYFENKKKISNGDGPVAKSSILNSFFKIGDERIPAAETTSNNICQKYLVNIDETFLDINMFMHKTDICQSCFRGELIPADDDGVIICNACFRNFKYLVENEKPSYKEPPKEVCFYAYKKINHFKEILAQFQGKETTQIPGEVIDNLMMQIKKERIEQSKLTYYKTKELLKKLGLNKYYEHINFIKDKLGLRPPIISQELEESLCNFFIEIQYPYARHCPDYRVNFLHYYYVLYKLFELLDETHYLDEIPMLKDREKLIEQDTIWKKICEDLNWEFFATI